MPALYRVILIVNGKYKSTLYRGNTRECAFIRFHKLRSENKVFFPKRYINRHKIKKVKYEICVSKITEEGDVFRTLRDDYGRTYHEGQLGDWTILDSAEYLIEEKFWLFGKNPRNDRVTITEIIRRLFLNISLKDTVKQIIVLTNKLIIYDDNQFDMVLCKNMKDAQRLHHVLAKMAIDKEIKNLIFMGTAHKSMVDSLYKLIKKKTKWKMLKIKRTTTRP